MVLSCSSYICTNRFSKGCGISFHRFPFKNEEMCKKWVRATKRKNFIPTKTSAICGLHFGKDDFLPRINAYVCGLKPEAVPSNVDFPEHLMPPAIKTRWLIIKKKYFLPTNNSSKTVQVIEEPWTLPPSIHYTLQTSVVGEVMDIQSTIKQEVSIKAEIIESDEIDVKPWTLPPSIHYTLQTSVVDRVMGTQSTIKQEVSIKAEIIESDEIEINSLPVKIESVSMKNVLKCDECERTFLKTWALMSHKRSHSRQKPFKPTSIIKEEVVIEGYGLTEVEENAEIKAVLAKDGEESLDTSHPTNRKEVIPETKTEADSSCFEPVSHRVVKGPGENPGLKPFACSKCSYTCSKQYNLKQHNKLKHSGVKLFSCSKCSFACPYKSNLKQHIRKHSVVKPLSCSECWYSCFTKSDLKRHMRTHISEKPFSCPDCSFVCSCKSYLEKHMRQHSGLKPLSCSECWYSCFAQSRLNQHLMTHTGVKPFSCSECSYSSLNKSRLKQHIMTHTGVNPLSCSECTFTCSLESSLNKHIMYHVLVNQL